MKKCSFILPVFIVFSTSVSAAEVKLNIPSDSRAEYFILEKGGKGVERTIVTKRVGPSGTSYSKRLYNCQNKTVKYLGTGDTISEMKESRPKGDMAEIVPDSIADVIGRQACK